MRPNRGFVLVAPVETSETFDGGTIILPQSVREGVSQYQCTVLAIGLPEICEDKKCERFHSGHSATSSATLDTDEDGELLDEDRWPHRPSRQAKDEGWTFWHPIPPELVVGAWVLVRQRCFIDSSHPTETQYFVHINNVEAVFVQSTEEN